MVDAQDQGPASKRFRHGGEDRRAVSALTDSSAGGGTLRERCEPGRWHARLTTTDHGAPAAARPEVPNQRSPCRRGASRSGAERLNHELLSVALEISVHEDGVSLDPDRVGRVPRAVPSGKLEGK
jgi:hypothetical protein